MSKWKDDRVQLRELKHDISVLIVERISASLDCTTEEYGQIYDSEAHEQMLNRIMERVAARQETLVQEGRIAVLNDLLAYRPYTVGPNEPPIVIPLSEKSRVFIDSFDIQGFINTEKRELAAIQKPNGGKDNG